METDITKLTNFLEGEHKHEFTTTENSELNYTTIYNMSLQRFPQDTRCGCAAYLWNSYKESFLDYINSKVLPSLQEKHEEFLLREFISRWKNHKVMVQKLSNFFGYLNRIVDQIVPCPQRNPTL